MFAIVKPEERHTASHGWLTSIFHFSFADYNDPKNQGWGSLRVFNDDFIASGGKFGMHPHANYEIMTVVLSGAIEHGDSMGNKGSIGEFQVQAMTAGTGIRHSEENTGKTQLHSCQIWIRPKKLGAKPTYKTATFSKSDFHNKLCKIVSGKNDSPLQILQDASISRSQLQKGKSLEYEFENEYGYLFVISGKLAANGNVLHESYSAKIRNEKKIKIIAGQDCDFLLFDLAP